MTDSEEKAIKVAEMLNSYSFSNREFCAQMCKEHRTLQQSFTRLCVQWLEVCASDEYRFDGRNEASHTLAKLLLENMDEDRVGLPFI